jgi:xylulokinase
MPALVHSGTRAGVISKEASELTGLAEGTPVVVAGGDLQCAGLGMGAADPGIVMTGIGTGAGVLIYTDQPLRHPAMGLNCLPHTVAGAWEMEGIALAAGAAYKWFRDVLGTAEKAAASSIGIDAYDILNAEAALAPPGAHGVIMMPSLVGAGAPNWNPKVRGVMLGLTMSTDKKDLARAVLEGICLELRWIIEAAEQLGTRITEVRIGGGAAKSRLWNQIAADVYGRSAARTEVSETGLVGASICAGVGVGMFSDAHQGAKAMVRVVERFEPNPDYRAMYDEMFEIYKEAYVALDHGCVFDRISAL